MTHEANKQDTTGTTTAADQGEAATETPPAPLPLLTLSGGTPGVVDTLDELERACEVIAAASGPIALDAERASGYRYSSRAYLIQLRRGDSEIFLIDPTAFGQALPQLAEVISEEEWILHAATQDIPCLREVGLHPQRLFDTELAGRLLGMPRVGLATLVEEIVGQRMRKEHSAADWSTRPLPESWLEYAALDVEVLDILRDHLADELVKTGKDEWARQEFEHLLGFEPTVRKEAWRRTAGVHKLRGRRSLAAARALWETRDEIARQRDVTPGRILPDSAVVAAATALPATRAALLGTQGFHGRGADRYSSKWIAALDAAAALDDADLPARTQRGEGPPHPRTWVDRDPVADRRYKVARDATLAIAEENTVPVENLITPDFVRRAMWTPPKTRDEDTLTVAMADQLASYGARPWQIDLVNSSLVFATIEAENQG